MPTVNKDVFLGYLEGFAKQRPDEFKVVVIDNAAFHSTLGMELPKNICLLRIPPYTPECNPCEQIWKHIKKYFKRKVFDSIDELKQWLYGQVKGLKEEAIKSITSNHHYLDAFFSVFLS